MTAIHNDNTPPLLTAHQRALLRWLPTLIADDEDWRKQALCAQADPERWFPDKGGNPQPAKDICRQCPVQVQCLEYALSNIETFGIWGGLTAAESKSFRRQERRDIA